jgi:hypothetical protein
MKAGLMNINRFAAVAAAVAIAAARSGNGFDSILEKLGDARTFDEAGHFYTAGTVKVIETAVREGRIRAEDRLRMLPRFDSRTRWEELSWKKDGRRGTIRIRYTRHPVENMIGCELDFKLAREDGSWKIDLEDEMRQALLKGERSGPADYIKRLKSRY